MRNIELEPDFGNNDGLIPALAEKLKSFAAFNECERIVIEQTTPEKTKAALIQKLDTGVGEG